MNKYSINFTSQFLRKFKKLSKKDRLIVKNTRNVLHQLAIDPFQPNLHTHKYKKDYSTRVTGDIRIIWNFTGDNEITLYNFGGHEGKVSVYK